MQVVGQPVMKKDAMALVTGKPVYTQDLAPKDMNKPFSHFTLVPMFHLSGFICYFAYGIHGWTLNLCADPRDVRRDMSMMHSDAMSTPPVLVEMIYNEIRRGNQDKLMQEMERKLILDVLNKTGGNKSKAAELLGITREGLRKKLLRMGINDKELPHDDGKA